MKRKLFFEVPTVWRVLHTGGVAGGVFQEVVFVFLLFWPAFFFLWTCASVYKGSIIIWDTYVSLENANKRPK
jgi:hypothetical protein